MQSFNLRKVLRLCEFPDPFHLFVLNILGIDFTLESHALCQVKGEISLSGPHIGDNAAGTDVQRIHHRLRVLPLISFWPAIL